MLFRISQTFFLVLFLMESTSSSTLPFSGFLATGSSFQDQSSLFSVIGDPSSHHASIAFIDSRVDDPLALMAGFEADLRVLLDPAKDGISQISEFLRGYQDLRRIDILTHGGLGELQIGSGFLNAESLPGYSAMLSEWQSHLAEDADILI
jgi:hypothetical protein